VALLAAFLIVDLLATASGHFEHVGGGDCGATSCLDTGTDKGYAIAIALSVGAVILAAWPWMVRRYRQQWTDPTVSTKPRSRVVVVVAVVVAVLLAGLLYVAVEHKPADKFCAPVGYVGPSESKPPNLCD
jgi:lysylphosphatidylglycerol synthetase-like protein (DUF2156 family)